MMIAALVALASLGHRRAFGMVVPVLWPGAQLHYSVFSIGTGSAFLGLGVALTFPYLAAPGVIVYAIAVHGWRLVRAILERRSAGLDPAAAADNP